MAAVTVAVGSTFNTNAAAPILFVTRADTGTVKALLPAVAFDIGTGVRSLTSVADTFFTAGTIAV